MAYSLKQHQLKVKAKSLAEEAAIIRKEEVKALATYKWKCSNSEATWIDEEIYPSLRQHRISDVRNEARATHLARAFIKGLPYSLIEKKRKPHKELIFLGIIVPRVLKLIKKYGDSSITEKELLSWIKNDVVAKLAA